MSRDLGFESSEALVFAGVETSEVGIVVFFRLRAAFSGMLHVFTCLLF